MRAYFLPALFSTFALLAISIPLHAAETPEPNPTSTLATAKAAVGVAMVAAPEPERTRAEEDPEKYAKCLSFDPMQAQFRGNGAQAATCPCEQTKTKALYWKTKVKNQCDELVMISAQVVPLGPDGFIAEDSFNDAYDQIPINKGDDTIAGKFDLLNQTPDPAFDFKKAFSRIRVIIKHQPSNGQERILKIFDIPVKDIGVSSKP